MKDIVKITHYDNGPILSMYESKKGSPVAEFKWFYPDGKVGVHCFYYDNNLDGEHKSYDPNGELRTISYYKNGIDITEQVIEKREVLKKIISL
jgi:antitoxin component YwqK of YwqJK toxin-antitoxin module